MNHYKVSRDDGIPVELFQILKDDAVKVLHSICQQIWKTQQWPQAWKRSVFIPIPKKGNAKECSNYCTIALISQASKVMLKILQTMLQQYMNHELPGVQARFRKGRGTRDQIPNICWIIEKAREFQKKHLPLLYWQCQSLWLHRSQQTVENSSRDGNDRPPDLPKIMASGPITSWQIDRETMETVTDFIFRGSKITGRWWLQKWN